MAEGWAVGSVAGRSGRDLVDGSLRCTPHLTSPLKGGRDELGREWVLGWVGSCLRRNDGKGAQGWREGAQE